MTKLIVNLRHLEKFFTYHKKKKEKLLAERTMLNPCFGTSDLILALPRSGSSSSLLLLLPFLYHIVS